MVADDGHVNKVGEHLDVRGYAYMVYSGIGLLSARVTGALTSIVSAYTKVFEALGSLVSRYPFRTLLAPTRAPTEWININTLPELERAQVTNWEDPSPEEMP